MIPLSEFNETKDTVVSDYSEFNETKKKSENLRIVSQFNEKTKQRRHRN